MTALLVVAACLTFAVLADLYDIRLTVRGIKAGVAVEGNEAVVKLARTDKPSFRQLLIINMLFPIMPVGFLGLIFAYGNSVAAAIPFSVALFLIGLKHILGGRQWAFLLAGGKLDPTKPLTAWQKFIQG